MALGDEFSYSHLFIAVPELFWEKAFIDFLKKEKLITQDGLDWIARIQKSKAKLSYFQNKVKGKTAFERLLVLTPELLNRRTIDILERLGYIDKKETAKLRLYLGIMERAGNGGKPKGIQDALIRARKVFGFEFADQILSYLVSIGDLPRKEANRLRAEMLAYRIVGGTLRDIIRSKSVLEALLMTGNNLVSRKTVEFMRLAGLIDARMEASLLAALDYGTSTWTVFEGSRRAEGLAARMAYLLSGSFSWELVDFAKALRILTPQQAAGLEIAVILSQNYNRQLMEQFTERRFRVVPGERPIKSFIKASKETEDEILRLLAQAAERARKEALALARLKQVGSGARAAELTLRANALHQAMREVWEGSGYITIFGEKAVAERAISSSEMLQSKYYKGMNDFTRLMLEFQARSGIDSFISRKENTLPLSRRVYGNLNLWRGKVDKEINIGLLEGKSAIEIAATVKRLIKPSAPGGVEYAAMRLARTELANAFHLTTIRHTREQPWVKGYQWNRSSSHGSTDICDQYANDDHDGLGPGIFKKANVPGKPHPNCMCYVTVVSMTEDQFIKALNAGRFNRHFATIAREEPTRERMLGFISEQAARRAGQIAGQVAISKGITVLDRMVRMDGRKNFGFNPVKAEKVAVAAKKAGKPSPYTDGTFLSQIMGEIEDIDFGDLPEPDEAKVAAALATMEKKIATQQAAQIKLANRQRRFKNLETEEAYYNATHPRGQIRPGDPFDLHGYLDMLPRDTDAQSQPSLAKVMYGTRAYRTMNRNLRLTQGRLKRYDAYWSEDRGLVRRLRAAQLDDYGNPIPIREAFQDAIEGMDLLGEFDDMPFVKQNDISYLQNLLQGTVLDLEKYKKHSDIIRELDRKMIKTDGDRFVYRVTGADWMGLKKLPTTEDIGHVFKDYGFTSTEGIKGYYTGQGVESGLDLTSRSIRTKIMIPEGSLATRINDFEREIMLARGSRFQILDVITEDSSSSFSHTVQLMLVNQDTPKALKVLEDLENTIEDVWEGVLMDF